MKPLLTPLVAGLSTLACGTALAGPPQPFANTQPSLVVNELMDPAGFFPNFNGGVATGDTLGFVYQLARPLAPSATLSAAGQTLPIDKNQALFSILGPTYGGFSFNAFDLPNLAGRTTMGAGAGAGLTPRPLGQPVGASSVTLTPAQVPAPGHGSAAQPYDTVQPSLSLEPLIAVSGAFPVQSGSSPSAFIGQIAWWAGAGFIPSGWAYADGSTLSIAQNPALFFILGTTYGGNGVTTFKLPDLQGRIAIGADQANPLGSEKGSESYVINRSELPGPGQTPLNNDQPSLAIRYIIATSGVFPFVADPFNPNAPVIGQISAFAGGYAPAGWAFADGQLLSIEQDPLLFAVLGTTYGGNGVTTFALPNLDGRTIVGAGNGYTVGETFGADAIDLNADNLPAAGVPEPSVSALTMLGFLAMGIGLHRGRRSGRGLGEIAAA